MPDVPMPVCSCTAKPKSRSSSGHGRAEGMDERDIVVKGEVTVTAERGKRGGAEIPDIRR